MARVVPLLDHSSEGTTYALLYKAFTWLGTLTKVLNNEGVEFHGEFQKLCEKTLINHHMTSQDHREINGLVEWMMRTMKLGLQNWYGL